MTDDDFGRLLAAQRTRLRDRAAYILRGHGDPDDLASEAILNVWSVYKTGRYVEQGQLGRYCYRVVSNLAFDWLRAETRLFWSSSLDEVVLDQGGLPVTLGDRVPSQQDVEREVIGRDQLVDALAVLSESARRTISLRMVGYTQREIGDVLGISEEAVETRIFRARERVRAHYSGVKAAAPLLQNQARKTLDGLYTVPTSHCHRGGCPADHNHALPLSRLVA